MAQRTTRLTDAQLETLIEVVFIVCLADGELEQAELARVRERLVQLEDGRLHSERVEGLMLDAAVKIQKEGRKARLAHAHDVLGDDEARRIALALAIDVARADGVDSNEREAAMAVADAFSIARADVEKLLATE